MPQRSLERLRVHWEIERELAERLRNASREERSNLYGSLYDELFRRVPDHPQLQWRADRQERLATAEREARLARRFLPTGGTFLEIGAGDCALSLALAPSAGKVYAVEVSREIAFAGTPPANFELLLTDGRTIPVDRGSVDLAYSNQLMEHLHPDDATEQLHEVFNALRPAGRYICLTPNRLLGPSDISRYFERDVANGFHLREYSNRELGELFRSVGFASVEVLASLRGRHAALPLAPFGVLEAGFASLPPELRFRLKRTKTVRRLLSPGGGMIATKA